MARTPRPVALPPDLDTEAAAAMARAVEMGVRPSVSVRQAAELLGYDQATVRRLLNSRELQGFRGGCRIRGGSRTRRPTLRVYLDSVAAHQRAGDLGAPDTPLTAQPAPPRGRRRVGATTPGHRAAMALLAAAGIFTGRIGSR